jgi:hypothetical protein
MGMEVLGTSVWYCKIKVENREKMRGRGVYLKGNRRFA